MRWSLVLVMACSSSSNEAPTPIDSGTVVEDTATMMETPFVCAPKTKTTIDRTMPIAVAGDTGSTRGIFDPSMAGDAMAYSSVPSQDAIFTRIAVTADKGATWTYVADANKTVDVDAKSRLITEVTALVLDPTDDAARRYKLFAHTYVVVPGTDPVELHYEHGYIGLQTAPEPKGPWSTAEKLLGWSSSRPEISAEGAAQKLTDIPELAKCVTFTEPSAIVTPTTIELALGCVELAAPPTIRIVLLRSTDHGKTFGLVGTLIKPSDGGCAGGTAPQVNAAHLFDIAGKPFVIGSPAATVPPGFTGYNGCAVYEVEDLATARIRRNADGSPYVHRVIDASGRFAGACAYSHGAYYVSALTDAFAFRIFRVSATAP
jgi:hypothetical protein